MATIQKTTLKRFNGTDWDPVYLANSADISYIGTGFEVASGAGFEKGEAISASTSTYEILKRTVEAKRDAVIKRFENVARITEYMMHRENREADIVIVHIVCLI